jgi:hypothetical protein
MYITRVKEAFGQSYITVRVQGVANISATKVSGVSVGPATTGASAADRILVEGSDVKTMFS